MSGSGTTVDTGTTARGAAQAEISTSTLEASSERSSVGLLLDLGKARLSTLVLMTTAVGFVLASPIELNWWRLAITLIGTGLSALGANAWNQCIERGLDARMKRTANRPLPSGRLSFIAAAAFAWFCCIAGPALLVVAINPLTGALGLATLLIYGLIYTPLKTRTPLNTLVGAVCGAIPPMMGWTAAAGELSIAAWVLGGILFVWQIPHFLSLAWLYREDYERGGFKMLPVVDRAGRITCYATVLYSVTLIPLTMMLTLARTTGVAYAIAAAALGLALSFLALRFYFRRSDSNARGVFLASVMYLPLLLALMVLDPA